MRGLIVICERCERMAVFWGPLMAARRDAMAAEWTHDWRRDEIMRAWWCPECTREIAAEEWWQKRMSEDD